MRQTTVTCDKCRRAMIDGNNMTIFYTSIEISTDAHPEPLEAFRMDLCEGCREDVYRLIKGFLEKPEVR